MTSWQTRIGQPHTQILVVFLAGQFHIRRPGLCHSNRNANRGFYRDRLNQIHLSKQAEVWAVAHEFAHHLDKMRNRNPRAPWIRYEPHSTGFYYCLRHIITLLSEMGLIVGEYPWRYEYKQLYRWAKRDGLTA